MPSDEIPFVGYDDDGLAIYRDPPDPGHAIPPPPAEDPEPDDYQEPEPPGDTLLWVAVYLEDRVYGGPEEGGWYYDSGYLVADAGSARDFGFLPRAFLPEDEDAARAHARAVNESLAAGVNRGRAPTSSVNSEGVFVAVVIEGDTPPLRYPAERPVYE